MQEVRQEKKEKIARHLLMGDQLHVYKRENSRYWQCSTYLKGRNWRTSTREESLQSAKEFAEDWYLELRGKARAGVLKTGRTFREASEQFELEFEAITEGQRSPAYVAGLKEKLKVYLRPYFGDMILTEISAGKVQEYRVWRYRNPRGQKPPPQKTGEADQDAPTPKPPARSTIHHEIVALRHVLKTAERHGWIQHIPDLSPPYKASAKVAHRAWFSPEEYKRLYTATRSLRHTYICMRLSEGADIYQVAKNCRTSVEMIEKHYAVHLKDTIIAAAVNVRRAKAASPEPSPDKPLSRKAAA